MKGTTTTTTTTTTTKTTATTTTTTTAPVTTTTTTTTTTTSVSVETKSQARLYFIILWNFISQAGAATSKVSAANAQVPPSHPPRSNSTPCCCRTNCRTRASVEMVFGRAKDVDNATQRFRWVPAFPIWHVYMHICNLYSLCLSVCSLWCIL